MLLLFIWKNMAFVETVGKVVNQNKDKMFEDMDVDLVESISRKNVREEVSEEGEVSEDEDADTAFPAPQAVTENKKSERRFENRAGGFITGIDVFGKEEQARLIERAKRFGLDTSNNHTLSEKELKKLYWSVGANEEDSDKIFRFDSLTMYGTEAMSTKDIFEYFSDYAPSSIEWLSDNSCNVIWLDNLSAVRALLGLSKPLKYPSQTAANVTRKKKMHKDGSTKSHKEQESDIIMLDDDSAEESKASEDFAAVIAADPEAVDLDELAGDVPSGRWRKGKTHPHSDNILLRFARRTNGSSATEQDGRPARLPQPVFGMVGLISNSRKERIKKGLLVRPKIFQDDMGDERDFVISSDEDDNHNPWGTLAKSWGHIDRARRPITSYDDLFSPYAESPPPPTLVLPRLRPPQLPSILNRVGVRAPFRPITSRLRPYGRRISRSPSLSPQRQPIYRRMESKDYERRVLEKRKRARESSGRSSSSESDSDEEWTKRVKVPRMRMYADEEEKRSKERSKVVKSSEGVFGQTDLRSRLQQDKSGRSRRTPPPSSSHRARSPYRREDHHRRNDRESARRPVRDGGASSVWLRLERQSSGLSSVVSKPEESDEYESTDYESRTSSSSDSESDSESDRVVVRSTARYAHQPGDDDDVRRPSHVSRSNGKPAEKIDLRSKLNKKKSTSAPKPRSPLRIEIDNDEYYRLIGADKG